MLDKETMDRLAAEAFESDEIEDTVDLGFDPMGVVKGNPEDVNEFIRLRKAAKEK